MLTLTDTQNCLLTIAPVDAKGAAAPVDGVPAWTSSNPAVAAVEPSADGLSATVKAGVPGTATIAVSADADLGEGVTPIAGALDVTVTPTSAVAVTITAGDPTQQ